MDINQYLSFSLGDDQYAIDIAAVKEIIECGALTRVPGAPAWIRGVLNLRGSVVPVVDLGAKFGGLPIVMTRRTCAVIVELQAEDVRLVMGVLADSVDKVLELASGDIQPPPSFGPKITVDCIGGMADSNGRFVVLLNMDRILSASELLAMSDPAIAAGHELAALEEITLA